MSRIRWGSTLQVKLAPAPWHRRRAGDGARQAEFAVYANYGEPRVRLLQSIGSKLGARTMLVGLCKGADYAPPSVPLHGLDDREMSGNGSLVDVPLSMTAEFVRAAMEAGLDVYVVAHGVPYVMTVESVPSSTDSLAESASTETVRTLAESVRSGSLRRSF